MARKSKPGSADTGDYLDSPEYQADLERARDFYYTQEFQSFAIESEINEAGSYNPPNQP